MSNPPELIHGRARKALGQHFLFDPNILRRAALAAGPVAGRTVVEVGPGPGGLTRALLDASAKSVIAIEADARFASALTQWPEAREGRLHVLEADARTVDFEAATAGADREGPPAMIVANLPYNIGTALLVSWLKAGPWRGEMSLMFQKEVAERACARPGDAQYGRLSVLTQAVCKAHIAFTLPPGAFRPPPKVDSAVAVFSPLKAEERAIHLDALEEVSRAAFGQRRKMLRRALKPLAQQSGIDVTEWLESAGVNPESRAETVDQSQFRCLSRQLAAAVSGR